MISSYTYTSIDNLGNFLLLSDGNNLTGLYFADKKHAPTIQPSWICKPNLEVFSETIFQLKDYAIGKIQVFKIPIMLTSGTEFQKIIWHEIAKIPFGQTCTYEQLAINIGRPKSIRAVANAIAKNPISIIIPCHRVIGKNGSLTGYAGGLEHKKALLEIEK